MKNKGEKSINKKREIDVLAEEMFDGDVKKTLQYHFDNNMSIEKYVKELNKEEAFFVLDWTRSVAYKAAGGKEAFFDLAYYDLKVQPCLDAMNATEEEFRRMEKNPFVLKSLKKISILLIATILITVIAVMLKTNFIGKIVACILPVFIGAFSLNIAEDIKNIFKFKKAKKYLAEIDAKQKTKLDKESQI